MSPELAAKLLDDVLYQRVIDCIDLESLWRLEQELWASVYDSGPSDDDSLRVAREMLDRAFARIQRDPRRYMLQCDDGSSCARLERAAQERAAQDRAMKLS
jgi:hypothetical protein